MTQTNAGQPGPTPREQFFLDVFTTIFEDYGTNTWRRVTSYVWDDPDPNHVRGTIVEIGDGDLENHHAVDIGIVSKGIRLICEGKIRINDTILTSVREGNREEDGGLIDAYDADMVLQAGLFEELRYG